MKTYAIARAERRGDGTRRMVRIGVTGIEIRPAERGWGTNLLRREDAEAAAAYAVGESPDLDGEDLLVEEYEADGETSETGRRVRIAGAAEEQAYLRFGAAGIERVSHEKASLFTDRTSADNARGHVNWQHHGDFLKIEETLETC